jgi:hypothetical protein
METIHFKTVDPLSQQLLREASSKGIALNWERYEKQQPQDGFLRLGLACPYGCLQGPCRIDPFGRGAQSGICGLGRDGMAAAMLLRLTLQGVLEGLPADPSGCPGGEIAWPASLKDRAADAAQRLGDARLTCGEILAAAPLLSRPAASPEKLIRQALRLALFGAGLAAQGLAQAPAASASCRVGYGLLAGNAPTVALCGLPAAALVQALGDEAGNGGRAVRLVSLGDWIPGRDGFIPLACTSGEAETVLSSGKLSLLLAGPGTDPGLLCLCNTMKIPVISEECAPAAAEIIQQARAAFEKRPAAAFAPDAALVAEGRVNFAGSAFTAALETSSAAKIALIGGADSLFGSFGHLPVELAKALRGQDHALGAWNDAALWILKQEIPAALLDARTGPLAAVSALAAAGRLPALKGICFTGLKGCREFTLALGLAALGVKVCLATPIPLWGSDQARALLQDELAALGGSLTHFDHPAQTDELLDWFVRP